MVLDNLGELPEDPHRFPASFDANHFNQLILVGQGDADILLLGWESRGRRQPEFLKISLGESSKTKEGSGTEEVSLDLSAESFWTGQLEALFLGAAGGEFSVHRVEVRADGSKTRRISLDGVSMPTLPGSRRLEFQIPRHTDGVFETSLGLLPTYERKRGPSRFRATLHSSQKDGGQKDGGQKHGSQKEDVWVDEVVPLNQASRDPRWLSIRKNVSAPDGGTLVLQVAGIDEEVGEGDSPRGGGTTWGNPRLVPHRPVPGPDVILVVIDTLRADRLGSYGNPDGLTPHLDRAVQHSLLLTDLHAPAPWTLPSIASILTGLNPSVHGAGQGDSRHIPANLSRDFLTLPEILADAGFYTLGFYNNQFLTPPFGLDQGFDHYEYVFAPDDEIVERALKKLEEAQEQRVFLFLHLFGPHAPYEPPEEACQRVSARLQPEQIANWGCDGERFPDLPPKAKWSWLEALYDGEVAHTDSVVGHFLRELHRLRGHRERVLVVTSDHGEDFFERQDQLATRGYQIDSDHGHHFYRELEQVPGLIQLPGQEPGTIDAPTTLTDLFATILDAVNLELPPQQGQSLLSDRFSSGRLQRRVLTSGPLRYGPARQAIERAHWKLVHRRRTDLELYHLASDPREVENQSLRQPEIVEALLNLEEEEMANARALRQQLLGTGRVKAVGYLRWRQIKKLRSLGYLQ